MKPQVSIGFFEMFSAVAKLAEGLNAALADGKITASECAGIIGDIVKTLNLNITIEK